MPFERYFIFLFLAILIFFSDNLIPFVNLTKQQAADFRFWRVAALILTLLGFLYIIVRGRGKEVPKSLGVGIVLLIWIPVLLFFLAGAVITSAYSGSSSSPYSLFFYPLIMIFAVGLILVLVKKNK